MNVTIVVSSCVIALGWVATWYAGAWLITKLSPSWPQSTVAIENNPYWGACSISSTLNALITAGVSVPLVLYLLWKSPEEWFYFWKSPEEWYYSSSSIDFCYDKTGGLPQAALALVGLSFTVRTAVDMPLQFIHGLLTVESALHHVIYILAGYLIRRYCMMPINAAILMSMEMSTPFLNYYLFFRMRYHSAKDVYVAKRIFGWMFLIFRWILNAFGVLVLLRQQWWAEGGLPPMPAEVPEWEQIAMIGIVIANGLLQIFWGSRIIMVMMKRVKEKPTVQSLTTVSEPLLCEVDQTASQSLP